MTMKQVQILKRGSLTEFLTIFCDETLPIVTDLVPPLTHQLVTELFSTASSDFCTPQKSNHSYAAETYDTQVIVLRYGAWGEEVKSHLQPLKEHSLTSSLRYLSSQVGTHHYISIRLGGKKDLLYHLRIQNNCLHITYVSAMGKTREFKTLVTSEEAIGIAHQVCKFHFI